MVEKHGPLVARDRPLGEIPFERRGGLAGQRHLALLLALAAHAHPCLLRRAVEIVQIQPGQLADPQAAAIEDFEHGAVARRVRPLQLAGGHVIEQRVHLFRGHHYREFLRSLGQPQQTGYIDGHHALALKELKQAAHRRHLAPDADRLQFLPVKPEHPLAQQQQVDSFGRRRLGFGRRKEIEQLPQVAPVGVERVRRRCRARQSRQVAFDLVF